MKTTIIIHAAEEGGYWAEVPSIPGCVTQGDTITELTTNIKEAVDGCLHVLADNVKAILEQDLRETIFEGSQRKEVVLSYPAERVATQAH
ncbi:MAG: type II toxin-antitoxin system HicB family antitoxin [Gammaproteobacteria bacterium]|nr:type II toxin-antitoxin system HicB family antitoxin [Gammaproteobacteria bacterium]